MYRIKYIHFIPPMHRLPTNHPSSYHTGEATLLHITVTNKQPPPPLHPPHQTTTLKRLCSSCIAIKTMCLMSSIFYPSWLVLWAQVLVVDQPYLPFLSLDILGGCMPKRGTGLEEKSELEDPLWAWLMTDEQMIWDSKMIINDLSTTASDWDDTLS